MADMKKANELYKGGFNCGQIVATFLSETCGFDEREARAGLAGFGGGMHCGENCSAVIGGVYSLGMYCGQRDPGDEAAKEKIEHMTTAFTRAFRDQHGSLSCSELCTGKLESCASYIETAESIVKSLVAEDKRK
ncbi:MAG: C-GCAxxG-C-C family protein [Oscillospiraceae bacterium]|jgi:C_GCAxxG_C_C family probable redox protein